MNSKYLIICFSFLLFITIAYCLSITTKIEYDTIDREAVIKVVLENNKTFYCEQLHVRFMRKPTIHWYDLNCSKDIEPSEDIMSATGKFHVFAGWPETIDKPEVSFLNIGIPGPLFIRAGSWIGGQLTPHFNSLEMGETYEFKVLLKAPRPGDWHVHSMMNVQDDGPIIGSGRWITNTGSKKSVGSTNFVKAKITFNTPKVLQLGEAHDIKAIISLDKTIDELKATLKSQDEKKVDDIEVADRMEAVLTGSAFEIIPATTKNERSIMPQKDAFWQWEVVPKKAELQRLHLTVIALHNNNGKDEIIHEIVEDYYIYVDVKYWQSVKDLVSNNKDVVVSLFAVFTVVMGYWKMFFKRKKPFYPSSN